VTKDEQSYHLSRSALGQYMCGKNRPTIAQTIHPIFSHCQRVKNKFENTSEEGCDATALVAEGFNVSQSPVLKIWS
jgi:hypothetical protein